jgi:RNA polymerase sigma factor for flagellar operon FliA
MTLATKRRRTRKERLEDRWRRYFETRDRKLRNELVEMHLPLVRSIAAKLASRLPRYVDVEDLQSAGYLGLVKAVELFDPGRKVKFEIYAKRRIEGAMLDDLRRQDTLPREARERTGQVRRSMTRLRDELGREPSPWEIATSLGLTMTQLRDALMDVMFAAQVSLDPIFSAGDSDWGDHRSHRLEPVDGVPPPAEQIHRHELLALVDRFLNARERAIVRSIYHDGSTFKHIGSDLQVSESRVSQMHTELISRLRQRLYKEVAP